MDGPSRWHTIELFDEVSSTNDVVVERARTGAAPGLVVVAERQSAGRGRRGRVWQNAPSGASSLLVSALVGAPETATLVPLAAGLAVRGAGLKHGVRADVKWPNDVLLDGAKCAGVLVERHDDLLVIGIGIDVDWRGADRSGEAAVWTSIAEARGREVDRLDLLADLLAALHTWLNDVERDPNTLRALYQQACVTIGREVAVTTPSGTVVEGRALGIEATGALIVDTEEGALVVNAGDVDHRG